MLKDKVQKDRRHDSLCSHEGRESRKTPKNQQKALPLPKQNGRHGTPPTQRLTIHSLATMSLEAKIQDAATRNAELLHILHETDSAVPDLASQQRLVADLEAQSADAGARLRELDARRQRELREHESYRDSVLRRLAYKLGGRTERFAARAAREEREYFDALQDEHRAAAAAAHVDAMLADARRVRDDLASAAAAHAAARAALDGLYEDIFAGPSPGCPEEDARERDLDAALASYHEARSRAEGEGRAVKVLARAQESLARVLMAMEDALHASRRDMLGGGTFADMMERSALARAEDALQQTRRMVALARRSSPLVRELPPVTVAQGHLLGDVFFDNFFSDFAFHEKIKQSNVEVQRCAQVLTADLAAARQRHAETKADTDRKSAAVRETRMELQKAREDAFARIAGGQTQMAPLPSYSASVDNWWE